MPALTNRKPAKGGSDEHHRRISESLKEHHRRNRKPKKRGWLARRVSNHFSASNVTHRKVHKDPEVKKAKREARKAEGELHDAHRITKLSPERVAEINDKFAKAKAREEELISKAIKKHSRFKGTD